MLHFPLCKISKKKYAVCMFFILVDKGVGKNVYLCNDCRKQAGLADKKSPIDFVRNLFT